MPVEKASSPEEESGGEEEGTRASSSKRACDYCHRMKMRCINKENPPCNRCRQGGHTCTFNGPRKSKAGRVEDRLKLVETQMSTFQSSLQELLQLQRASHSASALSNRQPTPSTASTSYPAQSPSNVMFSHQPSQPPPLVPTPAPPSLFNMATIEGPPRQYRNRTESVMTQTQYTPPGGFAMDQIFSSVKTPAMGLSTPSSSFPHPAYNRQDHHRQSQNTLPPIVSLPPDLPSRAPAMISRPSFLTAEPASINVKRPASPSSSEEEDPDPAIASASFPGPWRSMLSLAEAARLKADNQLTKEEAEGDVNRKYPAAPEREDGGGPKRHPFDYGQGPDKKRRKSTLGTVEDEHAGLKGALPLLRGSQRHAYRDPVELGIIGEGRGRELFESFMKNCQFYIPVFDPEQDAWDSLRQRSPFVISATIYIGLKCEEAGGAISGLQERLREHAEKIGMSTLFTPVARVEVVQALIIMAQWGDTIYRPGGHALRLATEMGLWRCLPYLVQTGMGAGKTEEELAEERPLVVGARVWLTIFKTECQMAFNSGRPFGISLESVRDARRLLNHPLAIPTDSRLVPFCELQMFRLPLHTPFTIWPSTSHMPDLDQKLRKVNQEFTSWFEYWDSYYESRGYPADAMLRVTLTTMLCGTQIYCNSLILNGVRSKRDVSLLSEERHSFLLKAVKAAEALMTTAFRGEKGKMYRDRFRYANTNTHVNFAFVARFLIRMSSLVPEVVNIRQVGRDVESCAKVLSNVPGFQFAQLLRDILLKARKKHVLPPPSRAPSPTRSSAPGLTLSRIDQSDPLKSGSSAPTIPSLQNHPPKQAPPTPPFTFTPAAAAAPSPAGGGNGMLSGFSPNYGSESASNGLGGLPELDFGLAEQLFSEGGGWGGGGTNGGFGFNTDGGFGQPEQSLGFDSWYPFPPLDTDTDFTSLPMLQPYTDSSTALTLGGTNTGLTGLTPTPTSQALSQPVRQNSSAGSNQGQSQGVRERYAEADDRLFRDGEADGKGGGGGGQMGWW